jgi:hypothetical protein
VTPKPEATKPDAAEEAMEVLKAMREHAARCRQCRVDVMYCDARTAYERNFTQAYAVWDRLPMVVADPLNGLVPRG